MTTQQVSFNNRSVTPRTAPGLAIALSVSSLIILGLIAWFFPYIITSAIAFVVYCVNTRTQSAPVINEVDTELDEWSNEVEQVQFTYTQPTPQVYLLQSAPSVDNLTVMSYKELTEIANRYKVPVKRSKHDMIKSLTSVLA